MQPISMTRVRSRYEEALEAAACRIGNVAVVSMRDDVVRIESLRLDAPPKLLARMSGSAAGLLAGEEPLSIEVLKNSKIADLAVTGIVTEAPDFGRAIIRGGDFSVIVKAGDTLLTSGGPARVISIGGREVRLEAGSERYTLTLAEE